MAFIGLINDRYICPQSKDTLIWKGNASGGFTVMAYFNILEGALGWQNYPIPD